MAHCKHTFGQDMSALAYYINWNFTSRALPVPNDAKQFSRRKNALEIILDNAVTGIL